MRLIQISIYDYSNKDLFLIGYVWDQIFFCKFPYICSFFLKKGYLSTNCDGHSLAFGKGCTVYTIFVSIVHDFCNFYAWPCSYIPPCIRTEIGHFRFGHTSTRFLPSLRYSTRFLDLSAQGHFHPFTTISLNMIPYVGAVSNHFHKNRPILLRIPIFPGTHPPSGIYKGGQEYINR